MAVPFLGSLTGGGGFSGSNETSNTIDTGAQNAGTGAFAAFGSSAGAGAAGNVPVNTTQILIAGAAGLALGLLACKTLGK